jgi:hypothetical protein
LSDADSGWCTTDLRRDLRKLNKLPEERRKFCDHSAGSSKMNSSATEGASAAGDGGDAPSAGVAVADDHDDSNLIPITVSDVLYTASLYVAIHNYNSIIHGKRVEDNLRYHFDLIINEEGLHDNDRTILVTKSEETFLRTQVYTSYLRKSIDHLHAQRTTNRAKNKAFYEAYLASKLLAERLKKKERNDRKNKLARETKKRLKEERKRTNVRKDVIVLLL